MIFSLNLINSNKDNLIDSLIESLKTDNWRIIEQVSIALGKLHIRQTIPSLIAVLENSDWRIRRAITEALSEFDDSLATEALIKSLLDPNRFVREQAALSLSAFGQKPALEPLINAIIQDKDNLVRTRAIYSLGKLGYKEALEPLIDILSDNDWNIQQEAIDSLGRLGYEDAVEPLLKILEEKQKIKQFGNEYKDQITLVEGFLQWNLSLHAASALYQLHHESGLKYLIETLKNDDKNKIMFAALALGKLREKKAVEPLLLVIKENENYPEVIYKAIEVLGQLGDSKAVEPLTQILKGKNWHYAPSAADALGNLGDTKAVEELINSLDDKREEKKIAAAIALGKIGDKRAVKPLIKKLRGKTNYVPVVVADALGRLGDKQAIEPLLQKLKDASASTQQRLAALTALGLLESLHLIDDSFNLSTLYEDGDSETIIKIIETMERLGTQEAESVLKELIQSYSRSENSLDSIMSDKIIKALFEAELSILMKKR